MEIKMVTLKKHGDERGLLVAAEGGMDIPFEIKRVYYITGAAGDIRRGFHAHKTLKQVMFCVNGSCKVMLDDGKERKDVVLDDPSCGLMIDPKIWHEMYGYSENAVLLVLASDHYKESDYLRNYDDFIEHLKERKNDDENTVS